MVPPVAYDCEEWERYYRQARHTLRSAQSDREEGYEDVFRFLEGVINV